MRSWEFPVSDPVAVRCACVGSLAVPNPKVATFASVTAPSPKNCATRCAPSSRSLRQEMGSTRSAVEHSRAASQPSTEQVHEAELVLLGR
ncbi:MAG: hypothetical protein ACI841_002006 [Planctomycetota bacterium]|jgi:hypothetical protein